MTASTETSKSLSVETTPIPGFLRIDLTVHGDNRGWFKENWQREKMVALGLPDFGPVQNNISFNDETGVTRGIHAEPWDKFVSVATGRVFGAWVDLREGPSFGTVYTTEIDPSVAVYVPRGVGNAYQTLEPNTAYTYLVNDHWSPSARYTSLNLADETAAVPWPIPLERAILSDKDRAHPRMAQVTPFPAADAPGRRVLVTGALGQLGFGVSLHVLLLQQHFSFQSGQVVVACFLINAGDDVRSEVDDAFQVLRRQVQQVAQAGGHTLEVPDVGHGCSEFNVAHALTAHLGLGDFHTTALTNDALVTDALVFATSTFPVAGGAENTLAEEAVLFGLQGSVVDGLRLFNLALGPATNVVGGGESDAELVEEVDV